MNSNLLFDEFEQLFWQLAKKTEYQWKVIYQETFPGSQSVIMYFLEQRGPLKMSTLADTLHLTAGAVTTASNKLIERGFVSRTRDQQDRRVVRLEITDQGRTVMNELQETGRQMMKDTFHHVSDSDLQKMNRIFIQSIHQLNELEKKE
ncbi:MAG TPA: MarR family transcriptional regulator [Pseudogracilibacillus sp.]|nr:MarR family transcriptional regulator [Pseudogracilibacillus sp.]